MKQKPYKLYRVIVSSANTESPYVKKILLLFWFLSNSIALYFVPTKYSSVQSAAAMCKREGFYRNSDSFDIAFEMSGRVMIAVKLMLPTRCWYP